MRIRLAALAAIAAVAALAVAASAADDHATKPAQTPIGPAAPTAIANGAPAPGETPPALAGGDREGTVLWQRFLEDAIYTSTGLALNSQGMVAAGTQFNPPLHLEVTPLDGDGTPAWTHPGTNVYVDASAQAGVIASVDFDAADSTATVREFAWDSDVPLWTHVIHPCRSLTYQGWSSRKPLQVSADGSTIAVAVVMWADGGQRGRLFAFDRGVGTPAVDFDFPTGNVVATAISDDGDVIATSGWPNVYVYDRQLGGLRWSGPAGAGNDALDLSTDGRYLAWGWTTLYLREWDGATYAPVWAHTPGAGTYVGQCALSPSNLALAVAWDNGNSFPNEIVVARYDLPSLELAWEYDYGPGGAQHVDVPSQMLWDGWGYRLAVASWGGSFPEIHVFDQGSPTPIFTLDTPGSMFDVDLQTGFDGSSVLSACGKHVHAGTGGRGGDLYAVTLPATGTAAPAGAAPAALSLGPCVPNPFNPSTSLSYRLKAPGRIRLAIHDARGRLVRVLEEGQRAAGEHRSVWDGRDADGAPVASGLYLVGLEGEGGSAHRKALLLK